MQTSPTDISVTQHAAEATPGDSTRESGDNAINQSPGSITRKACNRVASFVTIASHRRLARVRQRRASMCDVRPATREGPSMQIHMLIEWTR